MSNADPFDTGHFYHIYNKAIDHKEPFFLGEQCKQFMNLAWYYRSSKCRVSYSVYRQSPIEIQNQFAKSVRDTQYFQIEILSYCLMPTHYHFLLRQNCKHGISNFMNNISNAFTRHYNLINERKGPIFIPCYKSRLIHTEEQLLHVSRYIHLNPYSSGIVKSYRDLISYKYSSLHEYFYEENIVNSSFILNSGYFLGNKNKYRTFVLNHADYQRSLENINIKYVKKWL